MGKKKARHFYVGGFRVKNNGDFANVMGALLAEAEEFAVRKQGDEPGLDKERLLDDVHRFLVPLVHNFLQQVRTIEESKCFLRQAMGVLLGMTIEEALWEAEQKRIEGKDPHQGWVQ